MIGINVRAADNIDFASLIVQGIKTIETRNTNSLRPYIGQRVGIIRTGAGKAMLLGYATIDSVFVSNENDFHSRQHEHHVPIGSTFDIRANSTKHCYRMTDPFMLPEPVPVLSRGIIARKIS